MRVLSPGLLDHLQNLHSKAAMSIGPHTSYTSEDTDMMTSQAYLLSQIRNCQVLKSEEIYLRIIDDHLHQFCKSYETVNLQINSTSYHLISYILYEHRVYFLSCTYR